MRVVTFDEKIAKKYDLKAAVLYQFIKDKSQPSPFAVEYDGYWWIRLTLEDFRAAFPWWNRLPIMRGIHILRTHGLVVGEQLRMTAPHNDMAMYYRVVE